MRYAQIRSMDISNGEGIGVSLFVQGCHFHCNGCFNPETWDFCGGKIWTDDVKDKFLSLVDRPYIRRVSILGGEPLCPENRYEVFLLCKEIKNRNPEKIIWIYSGYELEDILYSGCRELIKPLFYADVLVDGKFQIEKQDFSLKFRGSSNQRIIDIKKSLESNCAVLYKRR